MHEQLQLHRIARLISLNASTRHPIDFSILESRDTRTAFPCKYIIYYIISRVGSHLTTFLGKIHAKNVAKLFFPYVRFLCFMVAFNALDILLVN